MSAIGSLRHDFDGMLHDARVALRQLRVSLRLFRGSLDPPRTKSLRDELSWLAGVLGPSRDAQVLLDRLDTSAAETCPDTPMTDLLLQLFAGRYDAEAADARTHLAGARVQQLESSLQVGGPPALLAGTLDPVVLADHVGAELAALLDELGSVSQQLSGPTHAERMHDVRKSVKRVRYARRALASIRNENAHDEVHAALARLQDLMGEHHDSAMMRERLGVAVSGHGELADVTAALTDRENRAAAHAELRLDTLVLGLERAVRFHHGM